MLFDAAAAGLSAQLAALHPTDVLETAAGSGALQRIPKSAKRFLE